MDKRLIFCVLLVMLSGRFVGTYAQNITAAPAGNVSEATGNPVTSHANISTTLPSNVSEATGNPVTSHANISATPASNMSVATGNPTTSHANISATPASNMSVATGNPTTSHANISATPASNMSGAVSPNTTVSILETNITKVECGSKQLCVVQPPSCDPSVAGSCFFLGVKQQIGRNFYFDLSGESDGYIAATLTGGAGEGDPVYACAKSNGKVRFFSLIFKNGVLNASVLSVDSVKGRVNGKTIQCSFLATVPEPRSRATVLGLLVSTGTYNDTDGSVGDPNTVIKVSSADLENPNITLPNEITTTATPVTPTPGGAGVLPSLSTTITRTECGSSKLCAAEPSGCDPAAGDNCFFLSVKQQSGQIYNFELSGQSDGYVAAGLSSAGTQDGNHIAYICAKSNDAVKFFTATIQNLVLNTTQTQNSSKEQGKVNGRKIQCIFTADVPNTARSASYALSVSNGTYDGTTLGIPKFLLLTRLANLSDPTANLTNVLNYAPSLLTPTHSFLSALLINVCIIAFTAM